MNNKFSLDSSSLFAGLDIFRILTRPISTWKNLALLLVMILIWLALFDLVAQKITNKWSIFFNYHEGYRHPSSVIPFLPFSKKIIVEDNSELKIVFTGDSTSGGLLYHHSQAIPAYLNEQLNSNGLDSHTYNMALSGAHLSDQYFLIKEFINYSDVIIFPIHYSFFTPRGENESYIFYPQMIDFLTEIDNDDLKLLNLNKTSVFQKKADSKLEKYWYTYRTRRLIPYILFGRPVKSWLVQKPALIKKSEEKKSVQAINPDLPFQNQHKEVQLEILSQNKILWERVKKIDSGNTNLEYLRRIGQLKEKSGKTFIAYFVPVDTGPLIREGIFDQEIYNQIISKSKEVLNEYEVEFIDFNNFGLADLKSGDFYNPDHLLPRGNEKVAKKLSEKILER